MTEIIKILLVLPVFLLFLVSPINVLERSKSEIKSNYLIYNLGINLNTLFCFSFINLSIIDYQNFYFLYLIIFLFYNYTNLKKISDLIKNKKFILIIFFITFFILSLNIASNLNLGWDAKYFYFIKNLYFFEGFGLNELSSFEHNKWHPYFGSYLWSFFWTISFFDFEYIGRLFYLFVFCFALYSISSSIFKYNLSKIFIYLILLLTLFNYERFSGLQEILIFSFLIIISKIIFEFQSNNKNISFLILLLFSNLILWVKAEGIVYILIILAITLVNYQNTFRHKLIFLASILSIILFKYLIYNYYNFEFNAQPYKLDIIFLEWNYLFYKLQNIIIYLGYYSLKNPIFLFGILIAIWINFKLKNKSIIYSYNVYLLLNLSFIFCAYLFRDLEVVYSLKTTLERIVFTSSAFYIYLVLYFINNLLKIKKWNI